MENRIQRLELENTLSQVYSNNYKYDSSPICFSFDKINFITLNSLIMYLNRCDIVFEEDSLIIFIDSGNIEMKYSDIKYLSISLQEEEDVLKS